MKSKQLRKAGIALAGLLAVTASGLAQEKAQAVPQRIESNRLYDVGREKVLQGTVVAFTANSTVAPAGAHVTLQTASGVVDVHLGNARLLTANHLSLQPGDSVQVAGENVLFGQTNIFAARTIQKGSQLVIVRTKNGMPAAATSHAVNANAQGGTIR